MTETIACAIAVHRALGPGFLESIYRRAMCVECDARGLAYEQERPVRVRYRSVDIPGQRIDLIVANLVVVELKAVTSLEQIHDRQIVSYLKTTGLRAGLLLNFGALQLRYGIKRVVL